MIERPVVIYRNAENLVLNSAQSQKNCKVAGLSSFRKVE